MLASSGGDGLAALPGAVGQRRAGHHQGDARASKAAIGRGGQLDTGVGQLHHPTGIDDRGGRQPALIGYGPVSRRCLRQPWSA